MRGSLHPLAAALAVAYCLPAGAQQAAARAPAPAVQLAPVTISASALDTELESTATPAIKLQGQALRLRRQPTLGDTLDGEPGIHSDTFGGGASRPVIRGQTAPRVRVLSDGSELMDASAVSPDHAVTVEPMLSQSIEVLRGPATLLYGGGAIGGVVNVLDRRIPTAVPERGFEGEAEVRGATGTGERAGAVGITAGSGRLAVRIEGMKRESDDYRVPDWSSRRLEGSYSRSGSGSIGVSWVTPRGYTGVSYTYLDSRYGLPGHSHDYESCHPHGDHLHCGGHDHDHGHGHGHGGHDEEHGHDHDHDHAHEHGVPYVKLRSNRGDLRGEYRDPFAGFERIRFRAGLTSYRHDEIEDGEVGTRFTNRGYDGRVELTHKPLAGWRGVIGVQGARSDFGAEGTEGFLPESRTRSAGVFLLEEYRLGDWRFEAGARQDWQRISPEQGDAKRHRATSLSAAAIWEFAPQYAIALSVSRSQRMPTAQELYADGIHLATNTYEIGNPDLDRETSRNIDLTLRKTEGATTFSISAFHNRVKNYIYAQTLDRYEDFRLIEYAQHDAVFNGVEGEVRHRFTPVYSAAVFGDYVRGRFTGDAGNLPRIPAMRAGVRLNADWAQWGAGLEFSRIFRQSKVSDYEDETGGYNRLDAVVTYSTQLAGADTQVYLRGTNLLDKLAYNHASFISRAAPLPGRSVLLGVRTAF
ncbi:TonB-dependent receptor [Orrella sp. JC864]|uniref:TonB-dependent receptor domain-containing protein n=1 Tax=Orrella sp. JC864 TaxID=3120298 RepID=UPI00300B754E